MKIFESVSVLGNWSVELLWIRDWSVSLRSKSLQIEGSIWLIGGELGA